MDDVTRRGAVKAVATGVAAAGIFALGTTSAIADDSKRDLVKLTSIQSKSDSIEIINATKEPVALKKEITFDGEVLFAWYTVEGVDMRFTKGNNNEKQIHRWLFEVPKIEFNPGEKKVTVSARAGMRDGSGDWDDTYSAKITVRVTALLR
jgi:hypothetical protein